MSGRPYAILNAGCEAVPDEEIHLGIINETKILG